MTMLNLKSKIQGPIAVIGDLHGQLDKLQVVMERLRKLPDYQQRWIVFIGDFVDRGPDPKGVIDLILQVAKEHPSTTAIMGNHEFAMCSALNWFGTGGEGSMWGSRWVEHYDSETTFESYGAKAGDLADLGAKVPAAHREFLTKLPWCIEHPQLLFVHAGLDPNLPFNVQLRILHQTDYSLNRPQWLCEKSFVPIDPPNDCPFTVVSGHVRVDEVVIRPKRILVDTTGGVEGELSCVLMPERMIISSDAALPKPVPPKEPTESTTGSSWWKIWR